MKKQPVDPFAMAKGGILALLVAALVLIAGHAGTSGTAPADDLVWVRQEPAIVNINDDPLDYINPDPRFEGSFLAYYVSETAIGMEERFVDHGDEYYHVTLDSLFDRPPLVLNPPLRYKITADFSHGGTNNAGGEGVGAQFWYDSDFAAIEPREVLAYYPWSLNFDGTSRKDWMIAAPPITQAGQTFEVYAGWWNCPPCNVTWTYRAEPANAVEQLGVEVVEPVVKYQGEAVPPGELFFPDTCDIPGNRATAACRSIYELAQQASVLQLCVAAKLHQIILILERSEISTLKAELVLYVAEARMAESCQYASRADGDYQLGLALEQGAMHLTNVIAGQTVDVFTALGSATATTPGTFLAGYNPDSDTATFRAYSAPLALQPANGAPLDLRPGHQVELTAAGFGPVTDLPQVYLPVQIR